MRKELIKVNNLTKTFGAGTTLVRAVDNVSFSVKEGDIILIMGPSGSGKTTLLTMLGLLLTPDSGKIYFEDKDITSLRENEYADIRANVIGFVFQSFNFMRSLTVLENVSIVLELLGVKEKEAKEKGKKILKSLGLAHRLNYDVMDLSGGEKQRVSIARALMADPKLILADEPTANLDSVSGHNVMELLRDVAKKENRAVIIVSHDMRLLDIADRVLWLEDGEIKEGHQGLVTDPVCKMKITKDEAPYKRVKDGETYYFCSKKCYAEFDE